MDLWIGEGERDGDGRGGGGGILYQGVWVGGFHFVDIDILENFP